MQSSFHFIDWVIVAVYLVAMAARRHLLLAAADAASITTCSPSATWAGCRSGLSLMAALNSGMDYLMQPSSTIKYGVVLTLGILSWLVLYPWVAHVAFPFYHRLNFYTVYEYLEARFDVRVRTLAAMIFVAVAPRMDGHRDVRAEPRDQRRHRRPGRSQHHDDRHRHAGDALHDARRHPGRDLERRGAVLHHVRRPGGDGRDRVVQRARRLERDLDGECGAQGSLDCVAAARRSGRDRPVRRRSRVSLRSR